MPDIETLSDSLKKLSIASRLRDGRKRGAPGDLGQQQQPPRKKRVRPQPLQLPKTVVRSNVIIIEGETKAIPTAPRAGSALFPPYKPVKQEPPAPESKSSTPPKKSP